MRYRSETLNRLVVRTPCSADWEAMSADGPRRYCAHCQRSVVDFAQLTAAEAERLVARTRGDLCVRLTHRDGRLVTAPPPPVVEPESSWVRRRVSAVAASLVGACLGAGAVGASTAPAVGTVAAAPAEPGREGRTATPGGATGTLRGGVVDDRQYPLLGVTVTARSDLDGSVHTLVSRANGDFAFVNLPAGLYEVTFELQGFSTVVYQSTAVPAGGQIELRASLQPEVEDVVVAGGAAIVAMPLRKAYDDSDVVVVATVGPSVVVAREDGYLEVVTDLQVEELLKGKPGLRHVLYQGWAAPEDELPGGQLARHAPGTRVLAFLAAKKGETHGGEAIYASADPARDLQELSAEVLAAHRSRLAELVRLERRAERRGGLAPDELVEWLVATAEEPLTRDGALDEIFDALRALEEHAETRSLSTAEAAAQLVAVVESFRADGGDLQNEPRPEVVGAYLDESHRDRLTSALAATATFRSTDRALFTLVRQWDEPSAVEWLVDRLGQDELAASEVDEAWDEVYWLAGTAGDLALPALVTLGEDAKARVDEIYEASTAEDPPAILAARDAEVLELLRDLRRQYGSLLRASC